MSRAREQVGRGYCNRIEWCWRMRFNRTTGPVPPPVRPVCPLCLPLWTAPGFAKLNLQSTDHRLQTLQKSRVCGRPPTPSTNCCYAPLLPSQRHSKMTLILNWTRLTLRKININHNSTITAEETTTTTYLIFFFFFIFCSYIYLWFIYTRPRTIGP